MLTLEFHPEVFDDIDAAFSWDELQVVGLVEAFADELETSYQLISRQPLLTALIQLPMNTYLI